MTQDEFAPHRIIMHVDMDAFYASVEQRDHPELRGKPVVVGGSPVDRGVVAAASYEAREYGIRSAMPMSLALRLCPHAIRRPPNFQAYQDASRIIHFHFRNITPLVEPVSLDEAYLDMSDHVMDFAHAAAVGRGLKRDIRISTQLNASVGIGPNKFLAKIASDYDKPDGFFIVHPEEVQDFLTPLPVRRIPGVGEKTERILTQLTIHTIQQLRECPLSNLQQVFGNKHGLSLYNLARGVDPSPVVADQRRKSLSQEHTFSHDLADGSKMNEFLSVLSAQVAEELEKMDLKGRTIGIKVRFDNFQIATRSFTIDHPTRDPKEITKIAKLLLERIDLTHRKVRLLGVRVAGFETDADDCADNAAENDLQLRLW
ncbi:MAG: DNA polymerase IV [Candidatus Omnitrophota bacterium]|jgi:nucleotidyltransferase/DNA polymerase involved in DNA repair|nr:MAG: DNA polymerase IV [Candidatus Omnitrophota bacterium]